MITSAWEPSSPAARSASAGSRIRRLAGQSLACTTCLTASVPAAHESNTTPAVARNLGRAWMRIHASVMMPRIPSLPITIRSGLGPAPLPGRRRDLPPAGRRQHPDRFDEVVDVGVVGCVVAAGASGDPASERGEPERLREVAQGVSRGLELSLERRPIHPRLDPGRPRRLVDLQHPVEAIHGDRDRCGRIGWIDAPHHRGPGAEWNRRVLLGVAPVEHGLELGLVAGVSDDVGRVREVEVECPRPIGEVGAPGVAGALVGVGEAERRQLLRGFHPGWPELGVVEIGNRLRLDRHAVPLGELLGQLLPVGVGRLLRLEAPRPEAHPVCHDSAAPRLSCRAPLR